MNVTIMQIPNGFKIRKKSDIETFINKCMCKGSRYGIVTDSGEQFIFVKDKDGSISVLNRTGDLTDMFNPSLEVARTNGNCYLDTVDNYIWQNRKYINAKWFKDKR